MGAKSVSFIVVDYSKGNLRSVQKGLELAGASAEISADVAAIRGAQALILPGVGSFADASAFMQASGQMDALRERITAGVPFLGICLGMQLLYERGDEGTQDGAWAEGLGILKGSCRRISNTDAAGNHYKVPHVGWNQVNYTSNLKESPEFTQLLSGIDEGTNFYFTHSYQCEPEDTSEVYATTTHAESIPCIVGRGSVFGVQHHPEKSSTKGLILMKNFVEYVKSAR